MGIKKYKPTSPGRRKSSVSTFEEITKTGLVFTTKDGARVTSSADSIVPVYPLKTNEDLYESLQGIVPEVYAIGACKDPKALIVDAVEDAAEIASSI